MYLKKIVSLLASVIFLMVTSFTVYAEDNEDYCYDESAFVMMTPEEVSAEMLKLGLGLDKVSVYAGALEETVIMVSAEKAYGRIKVFFSTSGTIVANEIGVKNLKFYRAGSSSDTLLKSDAKLYTGFQKSYSGGYYYTSPENGKQYYAEGTNYAIFTTTEKAQHTESGILTY